MTWGRNCYHSHKSPLRESPRGQGLHGVRQASPISAHRPWGWAAAGQREQVSQAERSDAEAVQGPVPWKDRTEERTEREEDTEVERFQDGERDKGERETVGGNRQGGGGEPCLNEGSGRQTYQMWWCSNKRFKWPLVTYGEDVFHGPGGAQILSLEEDKGSTLGTMKYDIDQSSWSSPTNRNWLEVRKKFRQGFIGSPAAAEGSENRQ